MKYLKNKKVIYILFLGIICLLPFILSPTYAKFISGYVTEDDIVEMSLDFDISITGIDEYHELEVAAGEILKFNVEIENGSDEVAYYGVWYKMVSPSELPSDGSIDIGRLDGTETTTSGSIEASGSKTVTIGIKNGSTSSMKVYIGVASSSTDTSDIEYLNGKNLITGTVTEIILTPFITDFLAVNAISDADLDFSQTSEESGTNGIYLRSGTEEDDYPIYYYRGAVDNNLIFADTCWKIVRTTEAGGLKLIYNGTPTDGQCNNTSDATQIGTSVFNTNSNSPSYAGYMYGTPYLADFKDMSSDTTAYVYGNSVSYSEGQYTLTGGTTSGEWSTLYESGLNNYHYTCFTTGSTCESVAYIYATNSIKAYYLILTGGVNIEQAFNEMIGADDSNTANYNTISSTIKGNNTTEGTIDYWYYTNIDQKGYSNYVEDTVWCTDRSLSSIGGFNPDGGLTNIEANDYWSVALLFSTFEKASDLTPSLTCARHIDKFTVSEATGNGDLDYPVGMLTLDELKLAGGAYGFENSTYYLNSGNDYWVGSPVVFFRDGVYVLDVDSLGSLGYFHVENAAGVRPSISLKAGFSLTDDGDGTVSNPYVVE